MNKSIIAITGPSGVGKTTLGDKLLDRQEVKIPRHCTTRSRRDDDKDGFYRYLSHEEYDELLRSGKFLFSSGDGPEVKKEYGNFYGILIDDFTDAWLERDVIVLFVSYKDIDALKNLKSCGIDVNIVSLAFSDIESGIKSRLINNTARNHTESDIQSRIKCAIDDSNKYGKALSLYAKTVVYTDICDVEQTYSKVCDDLGLRR